MEKVRKRTRRYPIRNLPLKWSFMVYILVCAVVAILLCTMAAMVFSNMQSRIYFAYEAKYLQEHGLTAEAIDGGMIMEEEAILLYRTADNIGMSAADEERYELYGILMWLSIPVIALLCILVTGILFYVRKLREPIRLIDTASSRIAAGNLDFTIHYENRNEMGRLASSFETMRAALQQNHQEMWRMMEQRKQLNAAFAHDLRTPLTVLKGYAEYLQTYVPQKRVPEDKLLSTINLMHTYVVRLEGYTAGMGAMQKMEDIQPRLQGIPFAGLCTRLQSAASMLRGMCELQYSCLGEGTAYVDADIITQVVENLVSNAARYAVKEIRVDVSLEKEKLVVNVVDDGPGFSRKILDKGVVPYNHSRNEDMHSEHFGLGLYICSVLCQRHGGELILPQEEGLSAVTAVFRNFTGP